MLLEIQLPYDHDYDGPLISTQEKPTPVTAQIFFVTLVTGKSLQTSVPVVPVQSEIDKKTILQLRYDKNNSGTSLASYQGDKKYLSSYWSRFFLCGYKVAIVVMIIW
jgi:hypothetical protein